MYLTLAEIQAFINFVNGNIGKKIFTDANPSAVIAGKKLLTNGVGLGVDMVDDISYQLGIVGDWDITTQPVVPVDLKIGQRYFVTTEGTYNGVFADVGDIVEFTSLTSIFVYPVATTLIRLSDLTNYATKTYAESLVLGLLDDRGSYDPTITSAYPTIENFGSGVDGAILKGDIWFFSSDGVCGVGNNVLTGYSVRALVDDPGQIDSNWNILSVGLGYVSENVDNKKTSLNGALSSPNDTDYPSTLVVDDALNLKADILDQTHTGAMRLPSSLKIYDTVASTKEVAVDVSGLTAGSPRTVTFPDRNIALGDLPLFAATTNYRQYAIIQQDGLLYSAKVAFTSGASFSVHDWDSIGGVLKSQITASQDIVSGYEYFIVASPNVAITLETPDPSSVPDGSRIVIHNLAFNAVATLGKTAWSINGTGFAVAPSFATVATATIPSYSKGATTVLTSRQSTGVWVKETTYGSTIPVGTTVGAGKAYFAREDDVTATVSFNLGGIPTATNRVTTVPNRDVTLGSAPAYANSTDYLVGAEVTYSGALYICNTGHTSASAVPDFTKFYPASGILEVVTSATTFTVPDNTNIKLVRLQVTGATMDISGLNSTTQDGKVEISNALQASTCTVTCTGITTFREQNDTGTSTATALVLAGLDSAYITCIANSSNAYWRKIRSSSWVSTVETGNFVYAAWMGSVVKTVTGGGATFNIDELINSKAHSVTIRCNTSSFTTPVSFSFVSTKSFGAGTGFCDEGGVGSLGTCASGSPLAVSLAPNESWEIRYIADSGSVNYFSVKRSFTRWTAIPADNSVTLVAGFDYVATNTLPGKTYTLPITPSIGTIVRLKCNNFVAYNQTLARNGSLIDGVASNITLNRNGTYTFLYNALSTWETSFEDSVYLDANVISGTRNRVVGGSNNAISGVDNVVVGCSSSDFYGTQVTALGTFGVYSFGQTPFPRQAVILGTSSSPRQVLWGDMPPYAAAFGGITCCWTDLRSANGVLQYALLDGSNTPSSTNCPSLLTSSGALCSATHEVEFIISTGDTSISPFAPKRTYFAKRKVYVERHSVGVATVVLVTLEADQQLGDATSGSITCTVGTDQANNRLLPSVTVTYSYGTTQTVWQASVRITSHHNRK